MLRPDNASDEKNIQRLYVLQVTLKGKKSNGGQATKERAFQTMGEGTEVDGILKGPAWVRRRCP